MFWHTRGTGLHFILIRVGERSIPLYPPEGTRTLKVLCFVVFQMLTYLAVFVSRYKPTPQIKTKLLNRWHWVLPTFIWDDQLSIFEQIYFQAVRVRTQRRSPSCLLRRFTICNGGVALYDNFDNFQSSGQSHVVSATVQLILSQTWKYHGASTDNVVPLVVPLARGSLFVYSSFIPTENDHRRSCLWNIHPTFIGFRGRLF